MREFRQVDAPFPPDMAAFAFHPNMLNAGLFQVLMNRKQAVMQTVLFTHSHPQQLKLLVDLRVGEFAIVVRREIEIANRRAGMRLSRKRRGIPRCARPRRNACAPPIGKPGEGAVLAIG